MLVKLIQAGKEAMMNVYHLMVSEMCQLAKDKSVATHDEIQSQYVLVIASS